MSIFDLILLAVGVSMDAFAVSIAKGLATRQLRASHYSSVALWFGGFQALMPLLGYFVGSHFAPIVESCDHWIAFVLLALIGTRHRHIAGISQSRYMVCNTLYRCNDCHIFYFRSMARPYFWISLQAECRNMRWCSTYSYRCENSCRTSCIVKL